MQIKNNSDSKKVFNEALVKKKYPIAIELK